MNSDIAEAKRRLPLPALMHRVGLGAHAKKRALCPFHDDQCTSFSLYRDDRGECRFKCFAGCGQGDEITFLELYKDISNREAIKLFLEMAGVNGGAPPAAKANSTASKPTPNETKPSNAFDWQGCVDAFTDADALSLTLQRRYPRRFCRWLKESGLIGKYKGFFAFPVHDRARNVVATPCEQKPATL
jgi:hypothetical protein